MKRRIFYDARNDPSDREPSVVAALAKLNDATLRAMRAGEVFKNTGAGKEMAEAYEAWMTARARAGNRFARSLGYTSAGEDCEVTP